MINESTPQSNSVWQFSTFSRRQFLGVSIIIGRILRFREQRCVHARRLLGGGTRGAGEGGAAGEGVSLCKCTRKPGPRSTHPRPALPPPAHPRSYKTFTATIYLFYYRTGRGRTGQRCCKLHILCPPQLLVRCRRSEGLA